jgi:hypothetical protein
MVLLENASLLVAGLLIGTVSALVAGAPQLVSTGAALSVGPVAWTLGAAVVLGLVSCMVATRYSVRGGLIEALRSE